MKFSFVGNSRIISIDLVPGSSNRSYRAVVEAKIVDVEILQANNWKLNLLIDGKHVETNISSDSAKRWVTINGRTFLLTKTTSAGRKHGAGSDHSGELNAPMPGQIRNVSVNTGDSVKKGQTLLTMEAMKMEIRIQASKDGVVKALHVKQGQIVEREQILAEVEG